MRIVHEITAPATAMTSGRPYQNGPGFMGFTSAQIEVLICTDCAANHPELPVGLFDKKDAIYIEGDSKYIKEALQAALAGIESMESMMRKDYGDRRRTLCPNKCDGIDKLNGLHSIKCPRHPNYELFKKRRGL